MLKNIRSILLAGFIPMAGVAFAQGITQPDYTRANLSAFHGDAHTLVQAVRTIEQSSGGKVLEIRFTDADGVPGFHAAVLKDGQVDFMRFERQSGRLTPIDAQNRPVWMLNMRTQEYIHEAEAAKVPLIEAITSAEKSNGDAPAVAAGIATAAPTVAVHAYNVLLDSNIGVQRIAVDSDNDTVIADPQALNGWPS